MNDTASPPLEVRNRAIALGLNATEEQKKLMERLVLAAERQPDSESAVQKITTVKQPLWEGYDAAKDKQKAIEFFKQLEKADCGTFTMGRRGKISRLTWKYDSRQIAKAFLGRDRPHDLITENPESESDLQKNAEITNEPAGLRESARPYLQVRERTSTANSLAEDRNLSPLTDNISCRGAGSDRPGVESYDHSFLLRPGLTITVSLPLNITKDEANRLAEFIRSVPF